MDVFVVTAGVKWEYYEPVAVCHSFDRAEQFGRDVCASDEKENDYNDYYITRFTVR
tara:strand:- start:797 stop:964 length:168 start_codon:yes stop_codon:yes gene_type:complete